MTKDLQVLTVNAYYKNDLPGGIATSLHFVSDHGVNFCRGLEECLDAYDELTPEEVFDGLRKLAETKPDTHKAVTEAIMGIHWLQTRHHLVTDEYNGTLFCCIYRGALVNIEMNPVVVDLDAALASKNVVDVTDIVRASKAPGIDRGMAAAIRTTVDHARKR